MKRRDFIVGTAAAATVAALPQPLSAHAPIAHDVARVLRGVAAGYPFATCRNWRDPDRYTYLLSAEEWVLTMPRCEYPWETVAFVEDATAPDGRQADENAWRVDPLLLLTPDERAAFDRAAVADMRRRLAQRW